MQRKEIIGYDPSKGKVIHKNKISRCDPSKRKGDLLRDPSTMEACGQTRSL